MSENVCYCINSGVVSTLCANAIPCGQPNANGFAQCCRSVDTCHPDGFCYIADTTGLQTFGSNWYLGGCTDSTFNDESCPRPCRDLQKSNVVYNQTARQWKCCWNPNGLTSGGSPDCTHPNNETFLAPAPEAILAASWNPSLPIQTSSPSLPTQTSSALSTSSSSIVPSATTSATGPNGLSIGAQAGIGVGAGLAGLMLITLLAIFFRRHKDRRNRFDGQPAMPMPSSMLHEKSADVVVNHKKPSSLHDHSRSLVAELHAEHINEKP